MKFEVFVVLLFVIGTATSLGMGTINGAIEGGFHPVLEGYEVWNASENIKIFGSMLSGDALYVVGWINGGIDGYIAALNTSTLKIEWSKAVDFGGSPEKLMGISQDNDGNLIVVGWSYVNYGYYLAVVKMSSNGTVIWQNLYGDGNGVVGTDVVYNPLNSSYIVVGGASDTSYMWDISKNGTLLWGRSESPSNFSYNCLSKVLVFNNEFIVVGYGDYNTTKMAFLETVYENGTIKNEKEFGNVSYDNRPLGIAVMGQYLVVSLSQNLGDDGTAIYCISLSTEKVEWSTQVELGNKTILSLTPMGTYVLVGGYVEYANSTSQMMLYDMAMNGTWIHKYAGFYGDYYPTMLSYSSEFVYLSGNGTNSSGGGSGIFIAKYLYDVTPPELSILSPKDNAITNTSSIEVEWVGSDNVAIDHYEVSMDNLSWINVGTNESYTFEAVRDGTHVFYVKAVDDSGNECIESVNVTVDTEAPTIDIVAPLQNTYLNKSNVGIIWNAEDNVGIKAVFLWIDNGSLTNVTGTNRYTVEVPQGKHTLFLKATDLAGNVALKKVSFIVDTTPPSISVRCEGKYLNHLWAHIFWTATDNVGVVDYEISVDNGTWMDEGTKTKANLTLKEGMHNIRVLARDNAGNKNISSLALCIDTYPPRIGNFTVKQKGSDLFVTINAVDNISGVASIEYRIDNGHWHILNGTEFTIHNVNAGEHTISVKVKDFAGNIAEREVEVNVQASYPWLLISLIVIIVAVVTSAIALMLRRKKHFEKN
ncbi:MAG: PQQ-like beta-propeller repeat protein [Euryarchaeota archaeon]|nr:PQQ-like beta-propeller repeat protein [Euryarchaeota archaeon]